MNRIKKSFTIIIALACLATASLAQDMERVHKEFSAKKDLKISTTSGDCIIKSGSGDKIVVDLEYEKKLSSNFKPEFNETSKRVKLSENWYGSSYGGKVLWTIQVPDEVEIEFESASGDVEISSVNTKLEASTASGDIIITDFYGEIEISTASGDVDIHETKGEMDISTASGDVKAKSVTGELEASTASGDIEITTASCEYELSCASGDIDLKNVTISEVSSFSSASGDIDISLKESCEYDLEVSTASGDMTLDYNGNSLKGYFELTARKSSGSIGGTINFDRKEEYEKNDRTYLKYTIGKKGSSPGIYISTSSGDIRLKK